MRESRQINARLFREIRVVSGYVEVGFGADTVAG